MRPTSRVLFGLSLLCVLPALASCRVPQPPPQRCEGLLIEVGKVKAGKRTIEVNAKISSEHDLPVSFDLGDVRLYRGPNDDVSPNPQRGTTQRNEIPPKNGRDVRWVFPLNDALPTGTYTIEIKSIRKLDIEQPNKVEFQINV